MKTDEAIFYLKHTSKNDFNLEKWEALNRINAINTLIRIYIEAIDFLENHVVATETEETLLKILKGEENETNKKE